METLSRVQPDELIAEKLPVVHMTRALSSWIKDDPGDFRRAVESLRTRHGAVLFRGAPTDTPADLQKFCECLVTRGNLLPYIGEIATPRSALGGLIYTSTEYDKNGTIFFHNELCNRLTWPLTIIFACNKPASAGGATVLSDIREVTRNLPAEMQSEFRERNLEYLRNYGGDFGVSVEYAFGTSDRDEVEAYCRKNQITCTWLSPARLRTHAIRASHALHPITGEQLWLNYFTFYSRATLDRRFRMVMRGVKDIDMAYATRFADGEPISDRYGEIGRDAYLAASYRFEWRENDVLLLDNMLTAHSRDPFQGERKVWVAMAEAVGRASPLDPVTTRKEYDA